MGISSHVIVAKIARMSDLESDGVKRELICGLRGGEGLGRPSVESGQPIRSLRYGEEVSWYTGGDK